MIYFHFIPKFFSYSEEKPTQKSFKLNLKEFNINLKSPVFETKKIILTDKDLSTKQPYLNKYYYAGCKKGRKAYRGLLIGINGINKITKKSINESYYELSTISQWELTFPNEEQKTVIHKINFKLVLNENTDEDKNTIFSTERTLSNTFTKINENTSNTAYMNLLKELADDANYIDYATIVALNNKLNVIKKEDDLLLFNTKERLMDMVFNDNKILYYRIDHRYLPQVSEQFFSDEFQSDNKTMRLPKKSDAFVFHVN